MSPNIPIDDLNYELSSFLIYSHKKIPLLFDEIYLTNSQPSILAALKQT